MESELKIVGPAGVQHSESAFAEAVITRLEDEGQDMISVVTVAGELLRMYALGLLATNKGSDEAMVGLTNILKRTIDIVCRALARAYGQPPGTFQQTECVACVDVGRLGGLRE